MEDGEEVGGCMVVVVGSEWEVSRERLERGEVGWVVTAPQPPRHRSASTVSSQVSNVSPRRQGCIATQELIHVYDAANCTAEWNTLVFSCTRGGCVFKTTFRKLGHSGDVLQHCVQPITTKYMSTPSTLHAGHFPLG